MMDKHMGKKEKEKIVDKPALENEELEKTKSEPDVSKTEAQINELLNDLQRTRADFENFRKQVELQKENERKTARLATVFKILPLLDDFGRAIKSYEELLPLKKSFEKILKELDLTEINSAEGTEFDPDLHDAVMVEGEGEKEVIKETLRPGYYYKSEVLRPAMVKVKKA